ncbi:hypothetical protein CF394_08420 [Tetzosporium hominis]|uniref:Uncharacterized protein n=1 Tax=Tetzosporium hominis TaxID=2020506 RepID=A0A264W361_9BACL|nr:hypothetical protein [Tetzosporium hominis]OZS77995.1 hypothetical protein CF394_08420 [Tetzosporium hominis]
MVIRTIANRVGTMEINQDSVYFLQPLTAFETDDMESIEQAYEKSFARIKEPTSLVPVKEIAFQAGQIRYEYDVKGLMSFTAIRAFEFEEKLPFYLELINLAKDQQVKVLWQKENFVVDREAKRLFGMVIENDVMSIAYKKDPVSAVKELIIISLTKLNELIDRPKRMDFLEPSEEVIRFGETIFLKLNSLDEIEGYIQEKIDQFGEQKRAEELEQERLLNERSGFEKFRAHLKKKVQFQNAKPSTSKKKFKKTNQQGNSKLFVGVAIILLLAFGLNIALTQATEEKKKENAFYSESSEEYFTSTQFVN